MVARVSYTVLLALIVVGVIGCHSAKGPELRVVGVHEQAHRDVVFVQVTNPARHAIRLTKLQYTFAAEGTTIASGVVALARDVEPGAAIVVEVPLDAASEKPMVLQGILTAKLDEIVRIFRVSAQIQPHAAE